MEFRRRRGEGNGCEPGKSGGVRECPFKCVECDELDIVEDEKKVYEGFEIACEDSSKSREVPFGMLRSRAIEG